MVQISGRSAVYDPHRARAVIVDREGFQDETYRQDANGFPLATNAALNRARAELVDAINAANRQVIEDNNPSDVTREIDGNPNAPDDAVDL